MLEEAKYCHKTVEEYLTKIRKEDLKSEEQQEELTCINRRYSATKDVI